MRLDSLHARIGCGGKLNCRQREFYFPILRHKWQTGGPAGRVFMVSPPFTLRDRDFIDGLKQFGEQCTPQLTHISAYLFHILLFAVLRIQETFGLLRHFCDGKVFPESGAHPNERSLRCCCLSVSAKISLRQRRRVRRRIYPSWSERASEGRKEEAAYQEEADTVRSATFPFLPLPRLKASSASVAPPPPRDGTRREQETRAIARKLGTYSTGVGMPHITARFCLSLRDRSPMSLIPMTIQSCYILPRLARGGSLFPPSETQSNDCRHSRPGDGSCFPSSISRDLISTALKDYKKSRGVALSKSFS